MRWFEIEGDTERLVRVQRQYQRHAARRPEMRLYRVRTSGGRWRIIYNEPAMIATEFESRNAIDRGPPADDEMDPIWPGMGTLDTWVGKRR